MPPRVRKQPKTWSQFGAVRKKPSTYEAVTGGFHYHFRHDPAPWELDKDADLNKWYVKHREGSPLQVEDWEQFRDPYKLTYRDYIARQSDREKFVDGLIDQAEQSNAAARLNPEWVATLGRFFVPLRFPLHVLQMVGLYVGQMSPSSYITNCQHFTAVDQVRRIQRIAYWTKVLSNAHDPALAETATARDAWETAPEWQPLRKVLEKMMIAYDWGEAFAVLNLAVKPAFDALLDTQFPELARANGDEFLAQLFSEFQVDSTRNRDWSRDLVTYAVERDESHRGLLQGWVKTWRPQADDAIAALAELFAAAPHPVAAADVVGAVRDHHDQFLEKCGV